jgi:uncharacterized FAD-dependent dehydrogenase
MDFKSKDTQDAREYCVCHRILTLVHGAQHAGGELVNGITFLNQGHESSNPALVVGRGAEVGEHELLELVNLILQVHQVRNGLVSNKKNNTQ